MMQIV